MTPHRPLARVRLLRRWVRFNAVGVTGIGVQLALLTLLTNRGLGVLLATAIAVEASVLHNFHLHVRWTWRDRGLNGSEVARAFVRFHATSGALSLAGNLGLMSLFTGIAGLPPVAANILAICLLGVVNFMLADRIAFVPPPRPLVHEPVPVENGWRT